MPEVDRVCNVYYNYKCILNNRRQAVIVMDLIWKNIDYYNT